MQNLEIGSAELRVLAQMVRKVDFFSPLTIGQLEHILPHIRLQAFAAGEPVFRQGDPGDAFYIIYKGTVDVQLKRFFLFHKTVASLGPGDFFGEIALVSSEPRTATIVARAATELFVLISADFQFVLKENPSLAQEMKRISTRRKFDSAHSD